MDLFDIAIAKKLSGGGGGGGGGDSDFSTAQVTVVNPQGSIRGAFVATLPFNPPIEVTFDTNMFGSTLVLYRGKAFISFSEVPASISGGIQDIGGGGYLVTSDCTITF